MQHIVKGNPVAIVLYEGIMQINKTVGTTLMQVSCILKLVIDVALNFALAWMM